MKSFKKHIAEVAEPKPEEEKRFKAQHTPEKIDHPAAEDSQFTGEIKGKAKQKRIADQEGDANYDKAYVVKESEEDLNEISKSKMMAYSKAAVKDLEKQRATVRTALEPGASQKKAEKGMKAMKQISKRSRGSDLYTDKMTGRAKVAPTNEETDLTEMEDHGRFVFDMKSKEHMNAAKKDLKAAGMSGRNRAGHSGGDHALHVKGSAKAIHKVMKKHADNMHDANMGSHHDMNDDTYGHRLMSESVEQIDEISKALAGRYIKQAQISSADAGMDTASQDKNIRQRGIKTFLKRRKGVDSAVKRLTKDEELTAKQKKLDKNNNGKIDGHDLAMLRAKAKNESYDDSPASPDEASMAKKQAEFIQYVAREIGMHIENGKEFPEWMQNKLSALHQSAKDYHSHLGAHGTNESLEEVTQSATKKMVNVTGPDGKVRTVLRKARANKTDDRGQDQIATNESEQLDELSPALLTRYQKKADKAAQKAHDKSGDIEFSSKVDVWDKKNKDHPDAKAHAKQMKTLDKRHDGAMLARKKLIAKGHKSPKMSYEETDLTEAVKAGNLRLRSGESVKVSKQDAGLINQMMEDLNAANRRKMEKVMMTDKAGFEEILGFAREAL